MVGRRHGLDKSRDARATSIAHPRRRRAYGEERWAAVGLVQGIEITVVYTDQRTTEGVVRWIISARRATRYERETFHGGGSR
ncbi:MAG: BrnT family toxin [Gemmatimonadaceae bacterium]|nr:BrnT family toxin [Gemmatimonadaceae bacterium]